MNFAQAPLNIHANCGGLVAQVVTPGSICDASKPPLETALDADADDGTIGCCAAQADSAIAAAVTTRPAWSVDRRM